MPAQGQIAQQIFWCTAFTADMTKKGWSANDGYAEVAYGAVALWTALKDGMQNEAAHEKRREVIKVSNAVTVGGMVKQHPAR